jgi:hypothetical protein
MAQAANNTSNPMQIQPLPTTGSLARRIRQIESGLPIVTPSVGHDTNRMADTTSGALNRSRLTTVSSGDLDDLLVAETAP